MKVLTLIVIAVSVLTTAAAPHNDVPFPKNVVTTKTWTYSTQKCSTSLGAKSCTKKVPTSIVTKKETTRPVIYTTVTPTTYITPTKTVTVKSTFTLSFTVTTTLPEATETSLITVGETLLVSETTTVPSDTTITEEATETATLSTVTTTETVPAPFGFRYPTPGVRTNYSFNKRGIDISLGSDAPIEYNPDLPPEFRRIGERSNKKYPQKVVCTVYLGVIIPKTSTKTARTKTVYRPTKTITRSTGPTVRTTSTLILSPTVTIEGTSTETALITTTFSETSTNTVYETTTATISITETETAKYYEACGPQNVQSVHPNGTPLFWLTLSIGNVNTEPPASNAYECCAVCMADTRCRGGMWVYSSSRGAWYCRTVTVSANTCGAQDQVPGSYTTRAGEISVYVFNGQCGQWYWFDPV
ncbi:hypothetical protein ABW19_dt0200497 [Dactylella cylindrospora]|nr:hypothetical protein ABW19_dt0200497 [Dactylella cylindrospora]